MQSITETTCVTMRIHPCEPPSKASEKGITEINTNTITTFQAYFLNYPTPSNLPTKGLFLKFFAKVVPLNQPPLPLDIPCQVETHCSFTNQFHPT